MKGQKIARQVGLANDKCGSIGCLFAENYVIRQLILNLAYILLMPTPAHLT